MRAYPRKKATVQIKHTEDDAIPTDALLPAVGPLSQTEPTPADELLSSEYNPTPWTSTALQPESGEAHGSLTVMDSA